MISEYRKFVFLLFLLTPSVGIAHSPIKGIDNFYNGVLHPVFVPAHLLLLIAIGLFFAQQGAKEHQGAIALFLVATIVGLGLTWFSIGTNTETLLLVMSAAIGLLVAAKPLLGLKWSSVIAVLAGLSIGIDSAQEALTGVERLVFLIGSGLGIFLLLLYVLATAEYFSKKAWQRIGVRVIGSWVAASSLLVLALSFSTKL